MADKHWSITERLHQTVTNPNVIIRGRLLGSRL